jgi:hypothetical protein
MARHEHRRGEHRHIQWPFASDDSGGWLMLLATFAQREYIFGLTWLTTAEKPVQAIKDVRGEDAFDGFHVYHSLIQSPPSNKGEGNVPTQAPTLGFIQHDTRLAKCYSAAEAVARSRVDGVYLAHIGNGAYWYCAIRSGRVIRGSDILGNLSDLTSLVSGMCDAAGMAAFVTEGIQGIENAQPFDLGRVLEQSTIKPLKQLHGKIQPWKVAAMVFAVGMAGLGAYHFTIGSKHKKSAAEIQLDNQTNYVQSIVSAAGSIPTDARWLIWAYQRSRMILPANYAGWNLDAIDCKPASCTGTYVESEDGIYSLTPMLERFEQVALRQDHKLVVTIPLQTHVIDIGLDNVRRLPGTSVPFADWLGAIPLWADGGKLDGPTLTHDFGVELGASTFDMPSIAMEQASVLTNEYLDPAELNQVLISGSQGGFVPVALTWSFGEGKSAPFWRITFERVHRA